MTGVEKIIFCDKMKTKVVVIGGSDGRLISPGRKEFRQGTRDADFKERCG
ncbi:hypothetical protein [Emcibacter sp.]|nr:hypothetical protein [Emcibacter sp.]